MSWIIGAIVAVIVIYVIAAYNGFIQLKMMVDNGWAQIDVQLQRRFDLIPNLVETVKGYAAHEKETFENIAKAKQVLMDAKGIAEKGDASNQLSNALRGVFALSEAYPQLQANENFLQLQQELKGTEDKIAFSRQFYNDTVARLNAKIDMFPSNIIARMFNVTKREYFALDNPAAKEAVKVQF